MHFLWHVTRGGLWQRPQLRATFLLDDPNLHATHYGYLNYEETVAYARRYGFHLAIAMVPLDTWFTYGRTAALFQKNPGQLSLLMHGNNHLRKEIGLPHPQEFYERMLAQGLRRIDRFEKKHGIPVARIMAAPHGQCHENAARALLRTGYDALCISRPFPWLEAPPPHELLAGWFPAELWPGDYQCSRDAR